MIFEHKRLWRSLSKISLLDFPWLLNGDFNALIGSEELKEGDFRSYASKYNLFSNSILDNNIHDLGFSGPHFTWCNGQQGLAHRWARLDRFLANTKWILNFKNFTKHHLSRTNSDHSLLFLTSPIIFSGLITSSWSMRDATIVLLMLGPSTPLSLPCTPLCIVFLTLNVISSGGNTLV